MDSGTPIPENLINLRKACLSHAEDLIRAAKRILLDEKLPNISYHLAVLALEEIGKSVLIVMGYFSAHRNDSPWTPEKFYDDHVKKLFWAIWSPQIGRERITGEQIDSFRGLSRRIHDTRLQALYVDFDLNGPLLPSESISQHEAQNLIDMATARLEIEKLHDLGKIEDKNQETLDWFLGATSDREKRNTIFGSKSMDKLAELRSTKEWISWLKEEFDKAEQEARDALNQELERKPSGNLTKLEEKWKVKIRLFSSSHSIRPKPLAKWNELGSWIRLYPVGGKKDQLIAEFTLPKNLSVRHLWWAAWGTARRFVVALNIGTFGCFWWYVPEQISRFYEEILDLENKRIEVRVERNPILRLDWGHNALSEAELQNTALCFGMMPGDNKSELGQSMGAYITALAFLNKTDIHIGFETNSYELFYKSLKHGMGHFKDWDGEEHFPDCFKRLLTSHNIGQEEIDKHKILAERFESKGRALSFKGKNLTLSEVGAMKALCDSYFTVKFREMAETKKPRKNGESST